MYGMYGMYTLLGGKFLGVAYKQYGFCDCLIWEHLCVYTKHSY